MKYILVIFAIWFCPHQSFRPARILIQRRNSVMFEMAISDSKSSENLNKENENLANLLKLVMDAVDDDDIEKLEKSGLKVQRKQIENFEESPSDEEIDIMNQIQSYNLLNDTIVSGYDDIESNDSPFLSEDEFNKLKEQAQNAVFNSDLLDYDSDVDVTSSIALAPNDAIGVETILSPISDIAEAPPARAYGSTLEVEEWISDTEDSFSEKENFDAGVPATKTSTAVTTPLLEAVKTGIALELPINPKAEEEEMELDPETGVATTQSVLESRPLNTFPEGNLEEIDDVAADIQSVFQEILKVSMESSEENLPPESVVSETVAAVNAGNFSVLDVDSLLGEALSTIKNQLGINISEALESEESQFTMRNLAATSMIELAQNLQALEEESKGESALHCLLQEAFTDSGDIATHCTYDNLSCLVFIIGLYNQLSQLQQSLRKDSEEFDEKKQQELDELLLTQQKMTGAFIKGQAMLQSSAEQVQKVFKDMEDTADFVTALAMFPFKSVDKKVAFVLGLALFFKVPFDMSRLLAIQSTDFTAWFSIFTQSALCFTLFSHYGLIKAILTKSSKP